jgi:hypothetical protein
VELFAADAPKAAAYPSGPNSGRRVLAEPHAISRATRYGIEQFGNVAGDEAVTYERHSMMRSPVGSRERFLVFGFPASGYALRRFIVQWQEMLIVQFRRRLERIAQTNPISNQIRPFTIVQRNKISFVWTRAQGPKLQ